MEKILCTLLICFSLTLFAAEGSRLKDPVTIKGVRDNPIIVFTV